MVMKINTKQNKATLKPLLLPTVAEFDVARCIVGAKSAFVVLSEI